MPNLLWDACHFGCITKLGKKRKKVPIDYMATQGLHSKIPLKTLLFTQQDVSSRIVLGYKISPK